MHNLQARKNFNHLLSALTVITLLAALATAQQQASIVPTLVNFSGTLADASGKPLSGTVGVTFYLYKDQQEGSPLWIETQNVQPDRYGHYTVTLGATKSQGLPTGLFASGEARWLGVQAEGQSEQPRVMLLAVPYALKAGDAQTLGGLPASAFLVASANGIANGNTVTNVVGGFNTSSLGAAPGQSKANVGGSGTQNYIPIWTDSSGDLGNSVLYQVGSGATAKIGFNLKNPLASLDLNGTELVRGILQTATLGNATASKGFNSNPFVLEGSSFNSGTAKPVTQNFQWQAEPTGNNTTNPGATLNLLFFQNTNKAVETGLSITNTGSIQITNPGQMINATMTANTNLTAAIYGNATATGNGKTIGVQGSSTTSSGYGIFGTGTYTGTYGQGNTYGVLGTSTGGIGTYGGSVFSDGVHGVSTDANGVYGAGATGVYGTSSNGTGVNGVSTASSGIGVYGTGGGGGYGVYGTAGAVGVLGSNNSGGWGVFGSTSSGIAGVGGTFGGSSGLGFGTAGVWGDSDSGAPGVVGTSDFEYGVYGESSDADGVDGSTLCTVCAGVSGIINDNPSGSGGYGIYGENDNSNGGQGIVGISYGNGFVNGFGSDGVDGIASNTSGSGVAGLNTGSGGTGVYGSTPDSSGYAGFFDGNISAFNLLYGASQMKIDHPQDPANRYLYHASVESSEMMTMYSGNVTLDGGGEARVTLPSWFESLNRDFRYQLTPIGAPGPNLYIASEITGNQFAIAGGKPGSKVSWTVTAVRQDAYAKAHPLGVETDKAASERGTYLHPELYGAAKESGLSWVRYRYPQESPKSRAINRPAGRVSAAKPKTAMPSMNH